MNKYLLDSHTFLWWILGGLGLSARATVILKDPTNDIAFSAASAWEILIKDRLGKLPLPSAVASDIEAAALASGFRILPVLVRHAQQTALLPRFPKHRDPFDRMLIAQSLVEGLTLISLDSQFDRYGVNRVW